jgi:thioredoxin
MPVLVNPKTCLDRTHCYAASGCPYDAYFHNALRHTWEVDATKCGDCPGPCLNFCDADAVRWADNLFELDLLRQQLEGQLTVEQVAERRAAQQAKDAAAAQATAEAAAAERAKKGGGVVVVTAKNFAAEVIQATLPVVMDCWAAWCAPCKKFAPIFEATAKEYAGMVKFVKLDTDAEPMIAQQLGIQALPTTLFFYKGQLVHGVQGGIPTVKDFSGLVYQVLAALRQMDPTLGTAPAPEATPAPNGDSAPVPAAGTTASGLIVGPDPGPAPAASAPAASAPAPRPQPKKPRLYIP